MPSSMLTRWCGVVLGALLLAFPAQAADEKPRSYAVVIGIDQYQDAQIKPHEHAEADARALYDLFTSKDRLGMDAAQVRLLLGKPAESQAEPATRENILNALRWVVQKAKRDDVVLLAFIGAGAPLGERACYFANDSTFKNRAKDAVAAAEIEHELEKLPCQHFCALLDVNFKGYDARKEPAGDLNMSNLYKEFLGKDEEDSPTQSRVAIAWNWGRSASPVVEKHGLFTQVILDGLKGAADKEGYEPDGLITLDELQKYMTQEVPVWTRKLGTTREEKERTFYVLGGPTAQFPLGSNPAAATKAQERLQRFEKLAAQKQLPVNLAEEGQRLLSRMPKLEAHRSLRKQYQGLADSTIALDAFLQEREQIREGMKLSESAARAFGITIMNAIGQVCEAYIKDLEPADLVVWAIRGLFQSIDEKVPQELKQRLAAARELQPRDLQALLKDARLALGKREDLAQHKDIDHSLQQMLRHLDPHTTYVDPATLAQFRRDIEKNYTGVGIQIRKDSDRDMLLVVTPIKGSPAYKAGIRAGDVITHIGRDTDSEGNPLTAPEILSTRGMALSEAVKKVLGKPDTRVRLTIEREGLAEPFDLDITRSYIELETVMGAQRRPDDGWNFWIDPETLIAYIRLNSFAGNTERDLRRAVAQLQRQGLKGLILDLRFNPGGLLRSAVAVSDLFIADGEIVQIRPRVGQVELHTGKREGSAVGFEMVCLINEHSASASEIVSACLQDYRRAVIMGERSFGKGSVQNIQGFDGGQLKLTIATFWRPSGANLNKASTPGKEEDVWGVVPDEGFRLKLPRKERDELYEHLHDTEVIQRADATPKPAKTEFKDRQLQMAVDYLRNQIRTAATGK